MTADRCRSDRAQCICLVYENLSNQTTPTEVEHRVDSENIPVYLFSSSVLLRINTQLEQRSESKLCIPVCLFLPSHQISANDERCSVQSRAAATN